MAKMTVDALTETKAFKRLSPQAQMFVLSYLRSDGDRAYATGAAYDVNSSESRRVFGYAILKSRGVSSVLRLYNDGVFLDSLRTELAARHSDKAKRKMRELSELLKKETK